MPTTQIVTPEDWGKEGGDGGEGTRTEFLALIVAFDKESDRIFMKAPIWPKQAKSIERTANSVSSCDHQREGSFLRNSSQENCIWQNERVGLKAPTTTYYGCQSMKNFDRD